MSTISFGAAYDAKRRESCFVKANGRSKFVPSLAAATLVAEAPVARFGGRLYVYDRGCYRPEGEEMLAARLTELLGDDWQQKRSTETVAYLRDSAPKLLERPPLDTINVTNGLLDVRTRKLRPHTPDLLSRVQLPVAYDPKARCPKFDAFLEQVQPDRDARQLLLETLGLVLVPDARWQRALMLLGPGSDGKSTFLNVATALAGDDNVSAESLHDLEGNRYRSAELFGKLANIYPDLDRRAVESSSLFKAIVAGDRITGEHKNQKPFRFRPFCQMIFSANEAPPTPSAGPAYFRRWQILPWDQTIEEENENLTAELTTAEELSGVLNHALTGYKRLTTRRKFTQAESANDAAERFRRDVDPVAGFLHEETEADSTWQTPKSALYIAYQEWSKNSGRQSLGKQRFNGRLRDQFNLGETKYNGIWCWREIRLVDEEAEI